MGTPVHGSDADNGGGTPADALGDGVKDGSDFPTEIPRIVNRFINQDNSLYQKGYDNKGELCFAGNNDENNKYEVKAINGDVEKDTEIEETPVAAASSGSWVGPWSEEEFAF